jgi:hypothetical protein
MRSSLVVSALVLTVTACGDSEMSMTEYIDEVNAIVSQAAQRYEALVSDPQGAVLLASGARLTAFVPHDLHEALLEIRSIEVEFEEAISEIDPPGQAAELHDFMFDFQDDFIAAQEALATRARTAASWAELSASPEMAAYRTALARDKQECFETESRLNAIAEQREVFADTPWIPGELKETFEAVLGCYGYPERPGDVYRP